MAASVRAGAIAGSYDYYFLLVIVLASVAAKKKSPRNNKLRIVTSLLEPKLVLPAAEDLASGAEGIEAL